MDANVIKEYLISLGFNVNPSSYANFNKILSSSQKAVESTSAASSASVVKAAGIVVGALSTIIGTTALLTYQLGAADIGYQKFALRMYMTNNSAKELKTTIDALGESLEDAAFIPTLRGQFSALLNQGRQMALPGAEYAQQMKDIQAIGFEFKRMKLEATFSLQWIGFYLMKYLAGPMSSIKERLKSINDYITKNMPKWTERVASWLASIINVARSLWWAITNVAEALQSFWDSFPKGVKVAIAAIGALGAFMLMSPVGQFIFVLSSALIMLEDFYGYMHGWKSSKTLAPMWKWMLDLLDKIQKKPEIKELKKAFGDLTWALNDLFRAAHKVMIELDLMDKLGSKGTFGKAIIEFFRLWISQLTTAVKSLTFIAQIIAHTLDGTIGDFLKKKLIDIQNTENKKNGLPTLSGGSPSGAERDSNTDFMALANKVSLATGIPAKLIYGQWYHESGGFTNWGSTEANNVSGFKQFKSQPDWFNGDAGSPEGDNYQVFDSFDDFAKYYAEYMNKYVPGDKSTPEAFARALKDMGYYGANVNDYAAGIRSGAEGYNTPTTNSDYGRGFGTSRSWDEDGTNPIAPSAVSYNGGSGNITQVNHITAQLPLNADPDTYGKAIASAIEPKTNALVRIQYIQRLRETQGVNA